MADPVFWPEGEVSILEGIKDLLFPARCQCCDRQLQLHQSPLLCASCSSLLAAIVSPLCTCCGIPFPGGEDHLCSTCLQKVFSFDRARSLFLYREPVSSLLVRFKFSGNLTSFETLSVLAAQAGPGTLFKEPDLVLPVPLHIQRLRSRGFNQSLLLARACFPSWHGKIQTDLLLRHQLTVPQTTLSGRARRNNLKGAFSILRAEQVAGRMVLLVDDVFTTGATLDECTKVLLAADAAQVEAFTLARAL